MNQVTPPSGVKGSAPVSPAPKSNVAVEPGEQFYERALRRRIRSWPDVSAAGFLTVELSQYLKGTGGATAEAVMAALLRLGHDGLVANGRRLASRLDTLTVSEARDVLEACGLAAERHARAMTRACEKDPEGISEREARERALCPAVTARLTGTYHAIPWDARHDGHLASREVSRAAGLVRWAHALTSERSSRVHLAVGRSLLFGRGAADVWKHRRPLVFIDRINAYTVKLVTDCWTADPQTAVVYAGNLLPRANIRLIIAVTCSKRNEVGFLIFYILLIRDFSRLGSACCNRGNLQPIMARTFDITKRLFTNERITHIVRIRTAFEHDKH